MFALLIDSDTLSLLKGQRLSTSFTLDQGRVGSEYCKESTGIGSTSMLALAPNLGLGVLPCEMSSQGLGISVCFPSFYISRSWPLTRDLLSASFSFRMLPLHTDSTWWERNTLKNSTAGKRAMRLQPQLHCLPHPTPLASPRPPTCSHRSVLGPTTHALCFPAMFLFFLEKGFHF